MEVSPPPGSRPRRLDGFDAALLASLPLALLPGARAVAAWPALWLVPGWFFARWLLGIEGFALVVLAPSISIAVTSSIALPATVLLGRPTSLGILVSIAACSIACIWLRPRPLRLPPLPPPPRAYLFVLGAFVGLRLAAAARAVEPDLSTPDGAYFIGMVRGLVASFPPVCFELAPHRLAQPWSYWFLYAATQVLSGVETFRTLGIASTVLAAVFAFALYFLAYAVTRDRLAASLTLPLALGGGGVGWIVRSLGERRIALDALGWGGIPSPAENLWDGFYDLPALVLVAVTLSFATLALHERRASLGAIAIAGAALLPFHHPTYFVVLALAGFAALLFETGRGTVRWPWLVALAVAPLPFYVLYARVYAPTIPSRVPFFTDTISLPYWLDRSAERLLSLLGWGGAWIALALSHVARPGTRAGSARSFVVALLGVSLALAVFTDNAAHNTHWTRDPLTIAVVVLSASAVAYVARARPRLGLALVAFLVVLGVISGHWERRLPERLAEIARPPVAPSPERDLAAWLRTNTPDDATVAVPANDTEAIDAVEGLAERRLLFGSEFHLVLTTPPAVLRAALDANTAILQGARVAVARDESVDFVVLPLRDVDAWRRTSPPVYTNERFAVVRARPTSE